MVIFIVNAIYFIFIFNDLTHFKARGEGPRGEGEGPRGKGEGIQKNLSHRIWFQIQVIRFKQWKLL